MKLQISFTYNSVRYQYTISEKDIDMNHYDDVWNYWVGENNNELNGKGYIDKDEEDELVFEITANKKWIDTAKVYIISGEDIYINAFKNNFEDDYCDQNFDEKIEVLYS